MRRVLDWLAAAVLIVAAIAGILLYGKIEATGNEPVETNAVRVEIQRYLGYEILPARYLSLPYDLTMNTNVYLPILDTGIIVLIFVPIVVLLGLGAVRKEQMPASVRRFESWALPTLVVVFCLFLLIIAAANGHIMGSNLAMVLPGAVGQYLETTSFWDAPAGVFVAFFYKLWIGIYQTAIEPVFNTMSGRADSVTYPVLLLCFGLFFYVGVRRFGHADLAKRALIFFTLAYLFFCLMLSAGIVWYGLLAFPLLTAFVCSVLFRQHGTEALPFKVAKFAFGGVVVCYLLIGFAHRISNLNMNMLAQDPLVGKRMFDPAYVKYLTGDFTKEQVYDAYYPGLGAALKSINAEDKSLIYSVGTRFNFFIDANDKRIFKDNQLDFFTQIIEKHTTKFQVMNLLKASGFKYMMVDFNTPSADRTPERSLVERYKKFMLLFYQNPEMELMATNRVIKETINGTPKYSYGVFGEIHDQGSYAIFKIK